MLRELGWIDWDKFLQLSLIIIIYIDLTNYEILPNVRVNISSSSLADNRTIYKIYVKI